MEFSCIWNIRGGVAVGVLLVLSACVSTESSPVNKDQRAAARAARSGISSLWEPLHADGLHDPKNPSLKLLQEPSVALSTLSGNKGRMSVGSYASGGVIVSQDGNKVDWMQALRDELISPRRARQPSEKGVEQEELVMDMDMFLDIGGSMPMVRFPHLAHTLWLACINCHPDVFVPQSGANRFSMEKILSGEQCGICHRAVAFPLTDCARCHSVANNSPEGIFVRTQFRAKELAKSEAKARVKGGAKAVEKKEIKPAKPVKPVKPVLIEKGRVQLNGKAPLKHIGANP